MTNSSAKRAYFSDFNYSTLISRSSTSTFSNLLTSCYVYATPFRVATEQVSMSISWYYCLSTSMHHLKAESHRFVLLYLFSTPSFASCLDLASYYFCLGTKGPKIPNRANIPILKPTFPKYMQERQFPTSSCCQQNVVS